MIYTSYWALVNRVPNPISISATQPKNWCGTSYSKLIPSPKLLYDYKNHKISEIEYVRLYEALLKERGITPVTIIKDLPEECTLICWEKAGAFCHRRVFANWMRRKSGIVILEWQGQPSLFSLEGF